MTEWRVMAEMAYWPDEDEWHSYKTVHRVQRRRWWGWQTVMTYGRRKSAKEEAIEYAERAKAADVPPVQVWP